MPGLRQGFQDRDGKAWRAHEDDPHGNVSALAGRRNPHLFPMASPEIEALTQALARIPGLAPVRHGVRSCTCSRSAKRRWPRCCRRWRRSRSG
jgi:hypothetical protein